MNLDQLMRGIAVGQLSKIEIEWRKNNRAELNTSHY